MTIIAEKTRSGRFHFVIVDRTNRRFPFNRSVHTWATKRAALAAGRRNFGVRAKGQDHA